MRTCVRCGADAVDADGVCAICGWRTASETMHDSGSSPSLGATRVASASDFAASRLDAPANARDDAPRGGMGISAAEPDARRSAPRKPSGVATRYCGACGARIGGDEVFCGQCGTPVGDSSGSYGTIAGRSPDRNESLESGLGETWMPGQNDQLTEAFAPAARGSFAQGSQPAAYRPLGYAGSRPSQFDAQGDGSARAVRIAAGLVCLGVSLVSAVLAILLAR